MAERLVTGIGAAAQAAGPIADIGSVRMIVFW